LRGKRTNDHTQCRQHEAQESGNIDIDEEQHPSLRTLFMMDQNRDADEVFGEESGSPMCFSITHVTQKDKNLYHVAPSAYVTTPADRLGLEH
jgi:hypothetical protein